MPSLRVLGCRACRGCLRREIRASRQTVGFVAIATFTQLPAILTGSVANVFALVTIALMLTLLPSVFHPAHGRPAAVCRFAGLVVLLATIIALGVHEWG